MIGNDVIDINCAARESNWKRKGYINKVFTTKEKELIETSNTPDLIVWLFWSMKEAAYKIYNRQTGSRFYAPQQFACHLRTMTPLKATGEVMFNQQVFYTSTIVTDTAIHTLATTHKSDLQHCKVISQTSNTLELKKDHQGLPYLYDHEEHRKKVASMSHHGEYEFIAYLE